MPKALFAEIHCHVTMSIIITMVTIMIIITMITIITMVTIVAFIVITITKEKGGSWSLAVALLSEMTSMQLTADVISCFAMVCE